MYLRPPSGVRRPYNLYYVGADVKPCSINQSIINQSINLVVVVDN